VNVKSEKQAEHRAGRLQPLGEAFLEALDRDRRRLLRLCTALEKMADDLPGSCQQARTARLVPFHSRAFERHIFLHEKCLFPLVRSLAAGTNEKVEPILRQLELEHATDHGLVLEITSFVNGGGKAGADVLGYLLRSFFENCRRHLSWERNILYPIAREHLTGGTAVAQHDAMLRVSLGASGEAVRSNDVSSIS
jgi:hemerythrin-like domain-containing protein